ncbi:MAG: T9SS type A sorting domain-containing protein [Chitinophagaceae bacterium]|nr:MAG: T9SS type A sorting domain-containing protein [Chitinophagaceae bacterium]
MDVAPFVVQQPTGITQNGSNTTFTFIGKFADNNRKQTFTANYYDQQLNQWFNKNFTFTKIKSLLTSSPASQIHPSPTSITANRCQTETFNISFANVRYGNPWETPPLAYGSITTYEYLIPIGWKLGSATSNGNAWLPGSNNEVLTSDLTNGIGGTISIRPTNIACGAGLLAGQVVNIPITRPAPSLNITGDPSICSGFKTYVLNGVPTGATVNWALSNSVHASIPIPSNNNSVNVTRITSTNISVILSATVTDCITTYPAVSKTIILGRPTISAGSVPYKYWNGNPTTDYNNICNSQNTYTNMPVTGATSVLWTRTAASPTNTSWSQVGNNLNFYFWAVGQTAVFNVNASNACGSTSQNFGFKSISCGGGGGCDQYRVSPNPAKGFVEITLLKIPPPCERSSRAEISERTISEIRIYDNSGKLKLVRKEKGAKQSKVNLVDLIPGLYTLEIKGGDYSEKHQLIIQ